MAALVCRRFEQNAWRRDLCANCFKSREEHGTAHAHSVAPKLTPRPSPAAPQGILRDSGRARKPKGSGVRFPTEESEVIGYGGEEGAFSDGDDDSGGGGGSSEEDDGEVDLPDGEEERALQRLTRNNTDFNSQAANLLGGSGDSKKVTSVAQLMLGQPVTDAEGRRRTLLVSVTPFGVHGELEPRRGRSGSTPTGAIETVAAQTAEGSTKPGKHEDAIPAKPKDSDAVVSAEEESGTTPEPQATCDAVDVEVETGVCEAEKTDAEKSDAKENVAKQASADADSTESRISRIPVIRTRTSPEKSKAINRTTAFNGRSDLQGKMEDTCPKPAVRRICEVGKGPLPRRDVPLTLNKTNGIRKEVILETKARIEDGSKLFKPKANNNYSETASQKSALKELNKMSQIAEKINTETVKIIEDESEKLVAKSAIIETHNSEIKPVDVMPKSMIVETKNKANSSEEHEKNISLKLHKLEDLPKENNPKSTTTHTKVDEPTKKSPITSVKFMEISKRGSASKKEEPAKILSFKPLKDEDFTYKPLTSTTKYDKQSKSPIMPRKTEGGIKNRTLLEKCEEQTKKIPLTAAKNDDTAAKASLTFSKLIGSRTSPTLPTKFETIESADEALSAKTDENIKKELITPLKAAGPKSELKHLAPSPVDEPNKKVTPPPSKVDDQKEIPALALLRIGDSSENLARLPVKSETMSTNVTIAPLKLDDSNNKPVVTPLKNPAPLRVDDSGTKQLVTPLKTLAPLKLDSLSTKSAVASLKTLSPLKLECAKPVITALALDDLKRVETVTPHRLEEWIHKEPSQVLERQPKPDDDEIPGETREQAGEPDGRADPDEPAEPPALPRSPPPILDPRPSFLHGLTQRRVGEKPKVPLKPSKVLQQTCPRRPQSPAAVPPPATEPPPTPEAIAAEPCRTPQKRQAPKPPPTTPSDENSVVPLFARNPSMAAAKSCAPIAREKEKRERAASCSPQPRDAAVSDAPCPEPTPRHSLSLSAENLAPLPPLPGDSDKKKGSRGRFSLRRLLRLGPSKEGKAAASSIQPSEDRPRLEIIHPLELNGSAVEVVRGRSLEDSASVSSGENKDSEGSSDSSSSPTALTHNTPGRPSKPPPPPRNQSLDAWGKLCNDGIPRPARPPPPKSAELLRQMKQPTGQVAPSTPGNNVYANLGEVRSSLAPNKPQRSASIRDTTDVPRRQAVAGQEDSGYESVELRDGKTLLANTIMDPGENVYECLAPARSSSPECDSGTKPTRYLSPQRRSDGCVDSSPDYLKFRGNFVRSASLPYCGSETESDIYSPYSFYGSEDAGDDESEWNSSSPSRGWKASKLRLRKGRSIVHKCLEDNYGAVVVANHEALAQVLEQQVTQVPPAPTALRGLKAAASLRLSDFVVPEEARPVTVGRHAFLPALWGLHCVSLSLTLDQGMSSRLPSRGGHSLQPLAEFSDLVPARLLSTGDRQATDVVQALVAVLPRLTVDSIQSYARQLVAGCEDHMREGSFVLLQLVNALKQMQAQGTEEAALDLGEFALIRDERESTPRLALLGSAGQQDGSLCQAALAALSELLPSAPLTPVLRCLLAQERASSLSQAKSVLEFWLWGPGDVPLGAPREPALQRWLDLERATVLHGLVRARVMLSAPEEGHLLFLVHTTARAMAEASGLLEGLRRVETTTTC